MQKYEDVRNVSVNAFFIRDICIMQKQWAAAGSVLMSIGLLTPGKSDIFSRVLWALLHIAFLRVQH